YLGWLYVVMMTENRMRAFRSGPCPPAGGGARAHAPLRLREPASARTRAPAAEHCTPGAPGHRAWRAGWRAAHDATRPRRLASPRARPVRCRPSSHRALARPHRQSRPAASYARPPSPNPRAGRAAGGAGHEPPRSRLVRDRGGLDPHVRAAAPRDLPARRPVATASKHRVPSWPRRDARPASGRLPWTLPALY